MNKIVTLISYNLGLWGTLGFFATIILGFISCYANLPSQVFYISLISFAAIGLAATTFCVARGCKKYDK